MGNGDVSTISVEQGENATIVLVRVPGAQRHWCCSYGYTDKSPGVMQVLYMGDGKPVNKFWRSNCQACSIKARCTTNKY